MEESGYSQEPTEHIIVSWKIKYFSFSRDRHYSLKSPEFHSVDAVPCTWFLVLEWTKNCNENNTGESVLNLQLIRKFNAGKMRCSVKFGYIIKRGYIEWLPVFNFIDFDRKFVLSNLFDHQQVSTAEFEILCEMVVYNDLNRKPLLLDQFYFLEAPLINTLFVLEDRLKSKELGTLLKISKNIYMLSEAEGGHTVFCTKLKHWPLQQKKRLRSLVFSTDFSNIVTCKLDFFLVRDCARYCLYLLTGNPELDVNFKISNRTKSDVYNVNSFTCENNKKILSGDFIQIQKNNHLAFSNIKFKITHTNLMFKNSITRTELYQNTRIDPNIARFNDKYSDFVIITGDTYFMVNKDVLMAKSKTFFNILSQNNIICLNLSKPHLYKQDLSGLNVSKFSAEDMHAILVFMYTGKLYMKNKADANKFYNATKGLGIYFLKERCEEF